MSEAEFVKKLNKCRYCGKVLERSKGLQCAYYVCDCEKAQEDYKISVKIQGYKEQIELCQKKLSDLRKGDEK